MADRQRFTAYVVFVGADHRRPWRIFTRRGWRHCFICIPIYYPEPGLNAAEYTLIINPKVNCIQPDVVFVPVKQAAQHFMNEGCTTVIKWRVDRKGMPAYVPRGVQNCISVVKAILGVAAWYVWTPEHLARWLVRNGGQIIEKE